MDRDEWLTMLNHTAAQGKSGAAFLTYFATACRDRALAIRCRLAGDIDAALRAERRSEMMVHTACDARDDPRGPFAPEADALADAREGMDDGDE